MVAVLAHPNLTANKNVHIRSVTTSGNDILAALERVTGKEWTKCQTTSEKERKEGQEMLARGETEGALGKMIRALIYEDGHGSDFDASEHVFNHDLGLPDKEDLDTVIREVIRRM